MWIKNANVFCADGVFRRTDVEVRGETVAQLGTCPAGAGEVLDGAGCYLTPGLVDIHIHGAMGGDFSDGSQEANRAMARYLLTQGVTSFLGTSMALPGERLEGIFTTARPKVNAPGPGEAALRGINMEGPFFNMEKRGAQNPEYIVPPDFALFRRLNEASGGNIRTVAVAPETEGGLDFVAQASKLSNVSLAHSCSDYETARRAFEKGANHVTHLFNGMPAFHHRDPGIVGAAAETDAYIELICDGVHVHPAMVRAVFQLFGGDRVCLISDAMRACGMPDGQYDLGGQMVTVANGAATIENGALAGSVSPLSRCLRKAVEFGIPLETALKAATINPAKSVGLDGLVGSIEPGKRADLLLLGPELELKQVIFGGQQ